MTLQTADRISRKFNDQVILDGVSFSIKSGDRIGLVGKNGCGKTTLFKIIAGRVEPDSGVIGRSKACRIDYIEQDISDYLRMTLFDYVASAWDDLTAMQLEIEDLERHLHDNPGDREGLENLGQLQNRFELEGGFVFEHDIEVILEGLGFEKNRHRDRIRDFSGGERNRAGLARALAGRGNLLLLDEPTNHLDIESTLWLEEFLREIEKSYIVVSHDRAFMSTVVDKVWELLHGKLEFYHGGLGRYLEERIERRQKYQHRYRHQQEEVKRLEEYVRRNMAGQKTKQAQSKLKSLNRIKRLEPLRSDQSNVRMNMTSSGRSFAHVLSLRNVSIGYGGTDVVRNVHFDLYRGDKVGLIGCNGSGKTTLLKSLVGLLAPTTGDVRLGNKLDVAYFDQELSDLDDRATVLGSLWEIDSTAEVGKIRSFLARFGFTGDDPFKLVAALSGGEKTKLSLARLLYHPANFTIFDEPTNNLDMDSRERLEEALIEYDGTCLVVSHDRYFLDRVVNRILYINRGTLDAYDGNYSYFREKTKPAVAEDKPRQPKSKESYLAFKEQSRRRSRHKRDLTLTRETIARLEKELQQAVQDIDHDIPRSDWVKLDEAGDRKSKLEIEILQLYAKLEELEKIELD